MGACVSVHKDPDSLMKLRLSFGSKTDNLVIPSPVKNKPLFIGDLPIADADADGGLKSHRSSSHPPTTVRDFAAGSKEETFFDSQPWLDSDCDDFFSVNGDFTPSRGSTPVHENLSAGTPRVNGAHFDDKTLGSKPEPCPKKKRLSDLFRDSRGGNQEFDDLIKPDTQSEVNGKIESKVTVLGLPPRSPFVSSANSVCSSERTPDGNYRPRKEKETKYLQCCLPRMLSSRSFNERKKLSPARSIG